ncbi:MAG: hypothetical protein R3F31_25290 [Verrucomicrobiales bacterium]
MRSHGEVELDDLIEECDCIVIATILLKGHRFAHQLLWVGRGHYYFTEMFLDEAVKLF